MSGHKFSAKKIDGNLLVIDGGTVNGQFVVFDIEEVKRITEGETVDEPSTGNDVAMIAFGTICLVNFMPCIALSGVAETFLDDNDKVSDSVPDDYDKGYEVTQEDYKIAFKWYQQAADQGDPTAMVSLGSMYAEGQGVTQDYKAAIDWYELAAAHGIDEAKAKVQAYIKARQLNIKAEQGDAQAQNDLGAMYEAGLGVTRDYNTAFKWYKLAADQGNAQAWNNLGGMYEAGYGVAKDYKAALEWYKLAANQGNAQAQNNLGGMYLAGQGVSQDFETAFKLYKLAAEQGDDDAQYNLAWMLYREGSGVTQDFVRAYMWWHISASQGNEGAAIWRDTLVERMTPSQVDKAIDLAIECLEKDFNDC